MKKTGEEAKIALRNQRREANDKLRKMQKNNEISEDDLRKAEDEVQKITDQYVKMVEEIVEQKEKEILEV